MAASRGDLTMLLLPERPVLRHLAWAQAQQQRRYLAVSGQAAWPARAEVAAPYTYSITRPPLVIKQYCFYRRTGTVASLGRRSPKYQNANAVRGTKAITSRSVSWPVD